MRKNNKQNYKHVHILQYYILKYECIIFDNNSHYNNNNNKT